MAVFDCVAGVDGVARGYGAEATASESETQGGVGGGGFSVEGAEHGFRVARPWGDSDRYDFILDSGERLWGVQVKSTEVLHSQGYEVQPIYGVYGRGRAGYTADDVDVLVVRIGPVDVWYVLPIAAVALAKNLRFYPDIECKCARWEGYREAWRVMGME
jgi:PD-(D/E)XK nuclease superfamily protein